MPRREQGHELVAQLHIAHCAAVLVAGREQQGEHVLAGAIGAALVDLLVDQPVDVLDGASEAGAGGDPGDVPLHEGQPTQQAGARRKARDGRPEAIHPLAVAHAEDRAQDHLERDRLQAGPQRKGLPKRPATHLARADLGHQVGVAADALTVEGGQEKPALAEVAPLVQREERVLAEHVTERDQVGLAGVEDRRVPGEDALDLGGVRDVHHTPVEGKARREHVAVAAPAGAHPAVRPGGHQRGLKQRRDPGPRREFHTHLVPSVVGKCASRSSRSSFCS